LVAVTLQRSSDSTELPRVVEIGLNDLINEVGLGIDRACSSGLWTACVTNVVVTSGNSIATPFSLTGGISLIPTIVGEGISMDMSCIP